MSGGGLVYTSPHPFTFRQRLVLTLASRGIAVALRAIGATTRTEVRNAEYHDRVVAAHGGHVLIAFWHESLALAAWHHRGTGSHTLTSYSFDGELAARVVRHLGCFALRGSSSRGGAEALAQMVKAVPQVPLLGFTLDGPRGPRRVAKPGVALLALRSNFPIVPVAFHSARVWRMNSWDRLMLPKPFARILCVYDEPIPPPPDSSSEAIEATRLKVEQRLNALHEGLERESA